MADDEKGYLDEPARSRKNSSWTLPEISHSLKRAPIKPMKIKPATDVYLWLNFTIFLSGAIIASMLAITSWHHFDQAPIAATLAVAAGLLFIAATLGSFKVGWVLGTHSLLELIGKADR